MTLWRKIERDTVDQLGEGTLWSPRRNAVLWVDILAPALNRLSLGDGSITRWDLPEPCGWVVEDRAGAMVAGFRSGFVRLALSHEAHGVTVTPLHDPEPHYPGNRMNDGKADRHGAIWCGTMDMAEEHARGSLYRLAPDGTCAVMDTGYMVPNGPAFSPCGQWLYHSDTARRTIFRFALTDDGPAHREVFATFAEADGFPDGMTADAEGFLWVAHWDGSRISRFAPDGKLDRAIELPARRVTNICFAGENLDRMFVSTAATGLPASPFDGALYEVESGAVGQPTGTYGG